MHGTQPPAGFAVAQIDSVAHLEHCEIARRADRSFLSAAIIASATTLDRVPIPRGRKRSFQACTRQLQRAQHSPSSGARRRTHLCPRRQGQLQPRLFAGAWVQDPAWPRSTRPKEEWRRRQFATGIYWPKRPLPSPCDRRDLLSRVARPQYRPKPGTGLGARQFVHVRWPPGGRAVQLQTQQRAQTREYTTVFARRRLRSRRAENQAAAQELKASVPRTTQRPHPRR